MAVKFKFTREKLDIIAAEAGFPNFQRQLMGFGVRFLYTNKEYSLNVVYCGETGKMVVMPYKPKGVKAVNFLNPEQVYPYNTSKSLGRSYTGRGTVGGFKAKGRISNGH